MEQLEHLNDKQREAVLTTEGPLLVLAGAGSGKTRVLIERIAHIIDRGVEPWRILAITFTNKAAQEIKQRLAQTIGAHSGEIWACTFHSACVRILRRDIGVLGYERGFTIYDTDDAKRVIKRILKALGYDEKHYPPAAILSVISRAKDAEQGPDEIPRAQTDHFMGVCAECYRLYQKEMKDAAALDFDDLILLTVRLLREYPQRLQYWQERFSYIMVDEYQDTNHLQYVLISLLAARHKNLCVVGDDDQSIYRFRGATIENILSFEQQYKNAKVVRLEQNYRSTGAILSAANKVIAHNKGRKGKTLWTGEGEGEPVCFQSVHNEDEEARFITETVLDGLHRGRSLRDYCVLYRMGAQSNSIERQLRMAGVPYRIIGGLRFFERAEVKDVMAYMQLVHNPDDNLRLLRIINVPARKLGDKTLAVVQALAARDGVSCFAVCRGAREYPELGRTAQTLESFGAMIEDLRYASETMPLADFYDELLRRSGYRAMLQEKGDEESAGRLDNILELKTNLAQFEEENAEAATLAGFLDETALYTDLDKYSAEDDTVVMMTMHAAKGLEFPVVFITGCEEGIFPSSRSLEEPGGEEEERRLCYVALTRAREQAYVLCAESRMLYGFTRQGLPSRFISEMGFETKPAAYREAVWDRPAFGAGSGARRPVAREMAPLGEDWNRSRAKPAREAAPMGRGFAAPKPSALLSIQKGQTVTHKKFGQGLVLNATPMGGDVLLEIAFDNGGTRKLMQKSAQAFLTILS